MSRNISRTILTSYKWFLYGAFYHLLVIGLRAIALTNNEISFTLNLRLIFTPIYGDYTLMGRLIGFVVRIFQIIFGGILLLLVTIISLTLPFFWYLIPLYIIVEYNILVVLYFALLLVLYVLHHRNIPSSRVSEEHTNYINSFRPEALEYLDAFESNMQLIPEVLTHRSIDYVLKKLELHGTDFPEKISNVKLQFLNLSEESYDIALEQNTRYVEPEQVFLAALRQVPKIDVILSVYNLKINFFESAIHWIVSEREKLAKLHFWQTDYVLPNLSGVGKGMTGRVTPFLDSISQDYTVMAEFKKLPNITGHQRELKEVVDLIGSSKSNVLLVGPPGSGKTSIVMGLAEHIVSGQTSDNAVRFKRIVRIETSSLIAGTKSAGDIAEKIKRFMEDLQNSGDIVLFFDDIHTMVSGANTSDGSTIFSLFEPYLANSKLQFIGATTTTDYRKYIEPNGSFARIFRLVDVDPTSEEETIQILEEVARDIEKDSGVVVTYPALVEVVKLSDKLIHERVFPDKAIDILQRTLSQFKGQRYITREDIKNEISEVTHVPVTSIDADEGEKLLSLASNMKKRVIGQDHAIDQLAKALQRARVGIRDEKKPIASFLFVGTTGVGKTETAKALAQEFFEDASAMIRLDMSEYQQPDSMSKLIGDPNGQSQGVLTEAVRTRPYALILLDEIEKAYSSILLTFLQVLDDGRLTDASGLTIDFTNTIIIATSNVGTKSIQSVMQSGGTQEEMSEAALNDVRDHYAPEFLNRFNGLIVFKPLSEEVVTTIADLMLNNVRKLADDKGIKLTFKPELLSELVKRGYNPEWGARPMSRLIEDTVESYIALKLLSKEFNTGDEVELGLEVFE